MSDHHQSSSPPNPDPPAAPDDETLMRMQRDFPRHRIWREFIPGRTVYVARSLDPAAHPHTAITPDLRELLATLNEASQAGGTR